MTTRAKTIYVAGHTGLVGHALCPQIQAAGCARLVVRTHQELELTDQAAVDAFFAAERPDSVVLLAGRVGGILANNTYPGDFIEQNLLIQTNVLRAALRAHVRRLLFFGSVCIYPREAAVPVREAALLTGPLEATNDAYAVAKIAGILQCHAYNRQHGTQYLGLMPANLYGPHDNFHPHDAHVIPALLRRFHEAAQRGDASVTLCGTGAPRREFLFADDLARAAVQLLQLDDAAWGALLAESRYPIVNAGSGEEVTIRDLAEQIRALTGFRGEIVWDTTKPDGTPSRMMDSTRMRRLGWQPLVPLSAGLAQAYRWFAGRK
ncbi:MAG: GDP-L-fucose synthase [Deltaproteobacteria bacterium]|nr:GDP-L-fucose synthase [Deltaproteobacteria bacterium]